MFGLISSILVCTLFSVAFGSAGATYNRAKRNYKRAKWMISGKSISPTQRLRRRVVRSGVRMLRNMF